MRGRRIPRNDGGAETVMTEERPAEQAASVYRRNEKMKHIPLSPRKKEVLYTVSGNLVLQIVTAICGFILPPLIIRTFGSPVNGMVSSISQFIAYLNIVEAGVGGASIAALYKPLADGDIRGRNSILSAASRFYNRSGVLFIILVLALAFVYPLAVGGQVDRIQAALMVLVLGMTGAAEFFLIGKYRVLLTADRKVYVISIAQMFAVIANTLVAVVLIRLGCGILPVKFASALVYLGRYVFLSLYVRRKYTHLDFHEDPDTKAIRQSRNVLVHQIGALVVYNSPLVIITLFCSLKDASVYTVYAMVFSAVNLLLGSFSNGMQSFFGESLVKDDIERTRQIFGRYETLFFAAVGWFYSMAYILIMPFMSLYTAGMTDAEYMRQDLALLFVVSGILTNIRNPGGQLINAAGHFKRTQWRSVAESVVNLVCSVGFTLNFGFIGVPLAFVCSSLYRTSDSLVYSSRQILQTTGFTSFLKILVFGLYFFTASRLVLHAGLFPLDSYGRWIAGALVYGTALAVPLFSVAVFHRRKKCPIRK